MELTIMCQNVKHGALRTSDGSPDDRWEGIADQVRQVNPDLLLLQELHGWTDHNHQQVFRAEADLGMRVAGGIVPAPSSAGIAVFYRHGLLRCTQWETRYAHEHHHGLGVSVFDVEGVELPLTVISVHLTPYSASRAAGEAQIAIARAYRYKGLGIIGGDVNHFPLDNAPPPDPESVPAYNRSSRWIRTPQGLQPNRIVGEHLATGGLLDVAAALAERTGDPTLLAPTGRGGVRVDQIHITPPLAPALSSYRQIPHPYSDHAAVVAVIDTNHINPGAQQEWV